MNNKRLIIHIGLHKTGTTYLQYNLFPDMKDVMYIHGNQFFRQWSLQANEEYSNFLLSYEGFSGLAWEQNALMNRRPNSAGGWLKSFKQNIQNLKNAFPNAIIVCVFRKPGDLLISMYKQYIHEGGILDLPDFFNDLGVIHYKDLSVMDRVHFLGETFEKVHFLNYNSFKKSGDAYFRSFLSKEFEIELNEDRLVPLSSNRSISGANLKKLRFINQYYGHVPLRIRKFIRYLRLSPRDFLQNRLVKGNTDDPTSFSAFKKEVNLNFQEDWEKFENEYQWKA